LADLGSKTDKKKWFVIEAENSMLKLFHFFPSFIALFTSTFYLLFIAFGFFSKSLWDLVRVLELIFLMEIVLNFVTSYRDPETLDTIYSVKLIAKNYVFNGEFFIHLIAFFPYYIIYPLTDINDWQHDYQDEDQELRNILLLKLVGL
jgi:hypothetical protein